MARKRPAPFRQWPEQLDQPQPGDGVHDERAPDLSGLALSAANLCCSDHDGIGLGDNLRAHLRRHGRTVEDLFRDRRWLDETYGLRRRTLSFGIMNQPMPPLGWEFIDG